MNNEPLVSIIMNCYNGEKYLKEAIDSVYDQTYKNWEIIFWDNASNDKTSEIAKQYADGRLRYFRSIDNVPLGQARNWAIEKATGDYIAFLDSDDIWLPKKLEIQINLIKDNNRIGLVYSDAIYFTSTDNNKKFRLYDRFAPPSGYIFGNLLMKYFLCLGTVMVSREAFKKSGVKFNPQFRVCEEVDVLLRIAHDWESYYIDEPLMMYRMHEESLSFSISERFPIELDIINRDLHQLYDDTNRYKKEFRFFESHIAYLYALRDFKLHKFRNVRSHLSPYLFVNKRSLVVYIFSFFPFSIFNFVLTKFQKYRI